MEKSNWFKKHTDTVIVLGGLLSCVLWMNSRFNEIETRLKVIETVLIMKNIMPAELACKPAASSTTEKAKEEKL